MLVIDASAALEWVFTDEATAESDRLFERVAREGAMVPAIFHAELANVLLQAERRKRISRGCFRIRAAGVTQSETIST